MIKVKFTRHARDKFELLKAHGFEITPGEVERTVTNPDRVVRQQKDRFVAQKRISEDHVLRVVFRERNNTRVVITFYPGRRDRYET